MTHKINIRGVMVPNDYKWYYDYFGMDCTCPQDIQGVLDQFCDGDEIEVYVNSPGGVIDVGSEIYTLLRGRKDNVKIFIVGEACSAASIAAMAGYSEMSPTALMMVHCVSSGVKGNHRDMEHMGEVLRTADKALCTAYMAKAGMTEADALEMMEHETWLTAEQAQERGLIDKIMFQEEPKQEAVITAGPLFSLPTQEQMEKVKNMAEGSIHQKKENAALMQAKLNLLKLEGNTHEQKTI